MPTIKTRQHLLIAFTALHFFLSNISYSQAGSLDPHFGNNGVVSSPYALGKVRVQNGKIITAGSVFLNGIYQGTISRYLMNGTPDGSLNGNGSVSFPNFVPSSLAVQTDNKMVVVGSINSDFAVMRFNPNGTLDNTFGNNGLVTTNIFTHIFSDGTPILSTDQANSVEVQTNGKIVVAGTMFDNFSQLYHFAVARYNSNGTLDPSFAQQGILVSALLRFGEVEKDMNLLSNGNILVYGSGEEPFFISALATYDPNGNFLSKYLTKSPGSSQGYAFALAVQQNQYELLGFSSYVFTPNNFPDNYFIDGATGMHQLSANYGHGTLQAIGFQQDGKLIVGGSTTGNLILLRFNADGSADNSFGQSGKVQLPYNAGNHFVIAGNRLYATGPNTLLSVRLDNCQTTVSIPDAYALPKGTDSNTVYLGYAPASSLTLSSQVADGTPPYSYHWSNGATTSSITVDPHQTTTYQLSIMDANQCTANAQKTVKVVDARCGEKGEKVLVCKTPPGHPSNGSTNCISAHAVPEQLKNGSYLGACKGCRFNEDHLMVAITPNPTYTEFTIRVQTESDELTHKIMLDVYNLSGQLIEERQVASEEVIKLGSNYKEGVYMLVVRNETEIKVFKLLKINH